MLTSPSRELIALGVIGVAAEPGYLENTQRKKEGGDVMNSTNSRSTIGLRRSTKAKLDRSRAPGQCYDGFLCQLVDMCEEVHGAEPARIGNFTKTSF